MKVSIAQLNPTVGDLRGNAGRVGEVLAQLAGPTDLLVFPELFLVGYPPRDLLEKPALIAGVNHTVDELTQLSRRYPDTGIVVGAPIPSDLACGKGLFNAALLIYRGQVKLQAKSFPLLRCFR